MSVEVSDRELLAEEMIARLMDAIESGDQSLTVELVNAHTAADLPIVVVALAGMLFRQEFANRVMGRQVKTFHVANSALFDERKKLRRRLSELEGINAQQAERIRHLRERLEPGRVAA